MLRFPVVVVLMIGLAPSCMAFPNQAHFKSKATTPTLRTTSQNKISSLELKEHPTMPADYPSDLPLLYIEMVVIQLDPMLRLQKIAPSDKVKPADADLWPYVDWLPDHTWSLGILNSFKKSLYKNTIAQRPDIPSKDLIVEFAYIGIRRDSTSTNREVYYYVYHYVIGRLPPKQQATGKQADKEK